MTIGPADAALSNEQLSALADGELDDAAVVRACKHWREDASHRSTWHAYHLIGDVMRSDDLASDGARDAAFLGSLRERLATEPVVLAPQAVVGARTAAVQGTGGARSARWSWAAPGAIAAGFVAVAGVVMIMRTPVLPSSEAPATSVAQIVPQSVSVQRVSVPEAASQAVVEPQVLVANGRLIRDVQLDRYLAAHKQFSGSSALGVPSAFLSNATSDASNR